MNFCRKAADFFGRRPPEVRDRVEVPFGREAGTGADQVGEDGDGAGVPQGGEAVEAEGVEVIAGEESEVGVVAGEQARLLVVEEVALTDGLDDDGLLAWRGGGSRAGSGEFAKLRPLGRVDYMW